MFLRKLLKEIKILKYNGQNFDYKSNNNNLKLEQEIERLKNELNYKNQLIEQQNSKIKNLENKINELNTLNNNNQSFIQTLLNNISAKEQELKSMKYKLRIVNEELSHLKSKDGNYSDLNNNEISFAINFISENQDMLYPMTCKISDSIVKLEEQLYNEYPKYKDYNTYLTVNRKVIKRFKTIAENGIKKGNAIIVYIYE